MKTPIVYTLISSEKDYFLEELWVSLYSLRQFHPEVPADLLVKIYMSERFHSNNPEYVHELVKKQGISSDSIGVLLQCNLLLFQDFS